MIETAASTLPMIIAGRRPTVSTNRPAGPTAMVWTTAAKEKAMPVQEGGRCRTSTISTGTSDDRTPNEVQPWAKLLKQAAW